MILFASIFTGIGILAFAMRNKGKTPFEFAQGEIGIHETPGEKSTARIVEYLQSAIDSPLAELDSTPWCAAFVNWCIEQAGKVAPNTTWAKSFLNYGQPVTQNNVERGDLVIFTRGDGGHVGFFAGWNNAEKTSINVLGGNQSDQVKYSNYSTNNLLGFRRIP